MRTDESLSNTFDMDVIPEGENLPEVIDVDLDVPVSTDATVKIESDYDSSRDNLKTLLQNGQQALESALAVAKQSEHPRAFEVVGNLIKQLADVNQQLMDLHSQKKKLDEPSKHQVSNSKNVTNNNAIFVGSTAELNKMIKKMTGE